MESPTDEPDAAETPAPPCPACGLPLPADAPVEHAVAQCPSCGEQFFVALGEGADGPAPLGDEDAAAAAPDVLPGETAAELELDGLRVRQIAGLRRGAYRARSYCFVAAAALAVVAVQLTSMAVRASRADGLGPWPAAYALLALGALVGCGGFVGRVRHLTRELGQSALPPPPAHEPDFSTLSDGSQRWKNLEDVR